MSEEELPEDVYRELLANTRATIETVMKLMKSEEEEVRVFAVDAFIKLSSLAAALAESLGEPVKQVVEERNPLARRARLVSGKPK